MKTVPLLTTLKAEVERQSQYAATEGESNSDTSCDAAHWLQMAVNEIERLSESFQFRLEVEASEARKKLNAKDREIEKLQVEVFTNRLALNTIAASKYCQYEHSGPGQYGIGVADGHRWCAQVAKDALK